jgi:hypothetical protein
VCFFTLACRESIRLFEWTSVTRWRLSLVFAINR